MTTADESRYKEDLEAMPSSDTATTDLITIRHLT